MTCGEPSPASEQTAPWQCSMPSWKFYCQTGLCVCLGTRAYLPICSQGCTRSSKLNPASSLLCAVVHRCKHDREKRLAVPQHCYPKFSLCFCLCVVRIFGSLNLTTVRLKGVGESFKKHSDYESKGIKAHFNMDESGVLSLDRVSATLLRCLSAYAFSSSVPLSGIDGPC